MFAHRVPLASTSVTSVVHDFVSETKITQTYVNTLQQSIECSYVFPVDSKGAVCDFEVEIGGRLLRAECQARRDAREAYETAVARGDGAYLVEQRSGDEFMLSIGNLPAGETAVVTLTYSTELFLGDDGRGVRFVLPTSIAPRYTPPDGGDESYQSYLFAGPDHVLKKPFTLDVTVLFDMVTPITNVTCTTDGFAFALDEDPHVGTVTVTRSQQGGLTSDIVINTTIEEV